VTSVYKGTLSLWSFWDTAQTTLIQSKKNTGLFKFSWLPIHIYVYATCFGL